MESSSKLAGLTLVSKYYPVANYSYPRNEVVARYDARTNGTITNRSSLGSEGSAPGLIDDVTDSEASVDDDYQYHAHASELWDSFWKPGVGMMYKGEKEKKAEEHDGAFKLGTPPRKQYPALIPSPQRRRRHSDEDEQPQSPAWPLPDSSVQRPRSRQPAATYSPFPKPMVLPRPGNPNSPSWLSSRPRDQPKRPPRPDHRLLTPCIRQQQSPVKSVFTSSIAPPEHLREGHRSSVTSSTGTRPESPEYQRPATSLSSRSHSPDEIQRPQTSHSARPVETGKIPEPRKAKSSRCLRPLSPIEMHHAKMTLANRPPTPFESASPVLEECSAYGHMPELPSRRALNHKYSGSYLTPDPEPRSFFEEDSEGEDEGGRSFFRFHKRSKSDLRDSNPTSTSNTCDAETPRRRRRGRTSPVPTSSSSPTRNPGEKKRNGVDIFGRMLGRRSQ